MNGKRKRKPLRKPLWLQRQEEELLAAGVKGPVPQIPSGLARQVGDERTVADFAHTLQEAAVTGKPFVPPSGMTDEDVRRREHPEEFAR